MITGAPIVRRGADGALSVEWAPGQAACLMTRELLDGIIRERASLRAEASGLRAELAERQLQLDDAIATATVLRHLVGDAIDAGARNDGEAIERIHREAGL